MKHSSVTMPLRSPRGSACSWRIERESFTHSAQLTGGCQLKTTQFPGHDSVLVANTKPSFPRPPILPIHLFRLSPSVCMSTYSKNKCLCTRIAYLTHNFCLKLRLNAVNSRNRMRFSTFAPALCLVVLAWFIARPYSVAAQPTSPAETPSTDLFGAGNVTATFWLSTDCRASYIGHYMLEANYSLCQSVTPQYSTEGTFYVRVDCYYTNLTTKLSICGTDATCEACEDQPPSAAPTCAATRGGTVAGSYAASCGTNWPPNDDPSWDTAPIIPPLNPQIGPESTPEIASESPAPAPSSASSATLSLFLIAFILFGALYSI